SPKPISTARRSSFRSAPTQDTFTDGEYEVTFIPYDDGDPNTWEGIIYRFTPDFGDDTRYGVINIQTDEPDVTQEVYYPSGGGDPQPIDPNGPAPIMNSSDELAKVLGVRTQEYQPTTCSRRVLSAHFVSGLATWSRTKEVM